MKLLYVELVSRQKGLSKTQLAKITGLSRQNLNAVMLGRVPPYPKYKRALAKALEWPEERADELFEPIAKVV